MWTSKNRARYDRSKLRYPSDLTDDEWGLVEPLIPPGKTGGGKRTVIMREVVNGLMYILSTGCQWRAIPKDLPPTGAALAGSDARQELELSRITRADCRRMHPAPVHGLLLSTGAATRCVPPRL